MIRFYNGLVLTMIDGAKVFKGEVWTDGVRIAYVGEGPENRPSFEREIDLRGDLVMPGFKNAHTHSAMTFLRSYADDLPLQSWLFDRVFPLEARLTPESIYAFTRLAILEYLTSGVTASFDMYFHRDAYAQANIDCGFRTVICGALSSGDKLSTAEADYKHFNSLHPLIGYHYGVHAEFTADEALLKGVSELVNGDKAPFYAHNSETKTEVDGCIERHGISPTAYFESLGLYNYGGGGFHCVHLNKGDMRVFARRGLHVVTCPGSNAKLASGIAPLCKFEEMGISLAVGTDGAASNNALDMFREIYLACVLQKLQSSDAAACPADRILNAATVGGAKAMGLTDCDCLSVGKQADIVIINMARPNMQPQHNAAKNLVYSGSKENVRITMIAGKILYEDGEFYIGEDPARIYAEAERYTKEIINNGA